MLKEVNKMATAEKHRKRSHRSYHNSIPAFMFANRAAIKKQRTENRNFFQQLFHHGNERGN